MVPIAFFAAGRDDLRNVGVVEEGADEGEDV